MKNIQSTKLAQEMAPLQARIKEIKAQRLSLEQALSQLDEDLENLEVDRQRYDVLQEVCTALGKLDELDANELFWSELPEIDNPEDTLNRLCQQRNFFQEKVEAKLQRKKEIQAKIERCSYDLFSLDGEVYGAYLREQERQSEFIIEREIPFFKMHVAVMPWSRETESERFFRRAVLLALLFSLLLGGIVPFINIPVPERGREVIEIPERFARLVKSAPVIPETPPPPKQPEEELKKTDEEKPVKEEKPITEPQNVEKTARKKIQNTGVLAFKDTFKDLIVDAPAAQLGTNARINNRAPLAAGKSSGRRSLVALQATGTSGGIDASTVSRNIGYGGEGGSGKKIGGVAFSRVESSVASLSEKDERSLKSGPGPARNDEEIQIVFDRYKATLYRIYNKELRKNPTLRGNILLRITIEPNGEVSACSVKSTDLASPELVNQIVARVMKFNFGPKSGVPKITILYPIDFLPAM